MEEDELVLITFKLKAKPQSMVVALLRATLFNILLEFKYSQKEKKMHTILLQTTL